MVFKTFINEKKWQHIPYKTHCHTRYRNTSPTLCKLTRGRRVAVNPSPHRHPRRHLNQDQVQNLPNQKISFSPVVAVVVVERFAHYRPVSKY